MICHAIPYLTIPNNAETRLYSINTYFLRKTVFFLNAPSGPPRPAKPSPQPFSGGGGG